MNGKKMVSLISGICGLLIGIAIIVAAVIDVEFPKQLWFVFAVSCLLDTIMIITNYKNYKKKD